MVITRSLTNRASASTATDIEFGNCVTEIGRGAFSGYTNITELELPNSLNRIGVGAFSGSSLERVNIPNSVISIGDYAFGCNLNFGNTFTSVTFGNSVQTIGENAFRKQHLLTSVNLPDSLKTIGASAFTDCNGLTELTIPSGVTNIGGNAFKNCSGLTRINVNATTPPTIGSCFDNTNECPIYVSPSSYDDYMSASTWSRYYSRIVYDGMPYKALFTTSSGLKRFIKCDTGTSVSALSSMPSSITSTIFGNCIDEIADNGFNRTSLGNAVIPSNVKRIGNSAFTSAYTESITFSEGLETIGDKAFYYFNNANNSQYYNYPEIDITLPSTLNAVGASAFTRAKVSSLTLNGNSTLEFNGRRQFKDYGSYTAPLKRITAKNIKSISGFESMSALTSVSISNVDTIKDDAFSSCYVLTNLSITSNKAMTIGSSAFYYCSGLTSVTLPNSVTSIGTSAFGYCNSLSSINIPANVTTISDKTFENCKSLSGITIPNTVTSVGASVFTNCSGLTSVSIPNTVTSIGNGAFEYCKSLSSVTLPSSITSLNDNIFYYCANLSALTIPNSIMSIGAYAFYYSGLMNVEIPSSVLTIGANAFNGCSKLVTIKMKRATPPTIASNTFSNSSGLIVVPQESLEIYKNAENWSLYSDRIVAA